MSIALKTALWRLWRALFAGAITTVIQWALANFTAFGLPATWTPLIMAVLLALDKWWREKQKA